MATLILTAVGTAVGGPIGGAVGALLGQQVDSALFAPKPRQGPRLGDLAVQTSSYGMPIPKIFGTMRVAGTVIWSTDLIESRSSSGGGKGRPETVSYSYSASFAVALSARPIRTVKRIWADGKLLRGAAGDFKTKTDFRLYLGDEEQEADPLIASAEGAAQTSAFRGIAYIVFENFELADYGNRIPSLSFEVEADAGEVAIGGIAEVLSEGAISAEATPSVGGYAAVGDSARAAIEPLTETASLTLRDRDGKLWLSGDSGEVVTLSVVENVGRPEILRRAAASLPDEVSLTYYDIERHFQNGLQRATLGQALARRADRRALPAALRADEAKAFAQLRLATLRGARSSAKAELGWSRADLRPGEMVRIEGESGVWRIEAVTLGPMMATIELVRFAGTSLPATNASPGRAVAETDVPHGPTTLRCYDLPLGEPAGGRPLLFAAAAGVEAGWRRAQLMTSFDGGAIWQDAGSTTLPVIIGTALTALPFADSMLFDTASAVDVELLNEAMELENASDDALVGGANLALVGRELIQFGRAEQLGPRIFRLTRLLRGRRGTEWAASDHQNDEDFCLIAPQNLKVIEAPQGSIGGEARINARGVGDPPEGVSVSATIDGEVLRPPSPVHLHCTRLAAGDIDINWIRRSRHGWAWLSGSDVPLGEEAEQYRIVITGDGFERTISSGASSWIYTAAAQAQDGAVGLLQVSVAQVGTYALSRPALTTII